MGGGDEGEWVEVKPLPAEIQPLNLKDILPQLITRGGEVFNWVICYDRYEMGSALRFFAGCTSLQMKYLRSQLQFLQAQVDNSGTPSFRYKYSGSLRLTRHFALPIYIEEDSMDENPIDPLCRTMIVERCMVRCAFRSDSGAPTAIASYVEKVRRRVKHPIAEAVDRVLFPDMSDKPRKIESGSEDARLIELADAKKTRPLFISEIEVGADSKEQIRKIAEAIPASYYNRLEVYRISENKRSNPTARPIRPKRPKTPVTKKSLLLSAALIVALVIGVVEWAVAQPLPAHLSSIYHTTIYLGALAILYYVGWRNPLRTGYPAVLDDLEVASLVGLPSSPNLPLHRGSRPPGVIPLPKTEGPNVSEGSTGSAYILGEPVVEDNGDILVIRATMPGFKDGGEFRIKPYGSSIVVTMVGLHGNPSITVELPCSIDPDTVTEKTASYDPDSGILEIHAKKLTKPRRAPLLF